MGGDAHHVRVLDAELDKFSHPIESNKKMVEAKARHSSVCDASQLCTRIDLPSDNVRAIFYK